MNKLYSLTVLFLYLISYSATSVLAIEDTNIEHIKLPKKIAKKSPTNLVKISDNTLEIESYNVLPLVFAQNFNSKNAKTGDQIVFLTQNDIITEENTIILPAGSKLIAEITEIKKPKSFNRSGKVYIEFKQVEFSDGTNAPLSAKVFDKKEFLSRGKLNALGKGVGSTLGGLAVGTAAGCGIGIAAGAVVVGGLAIGLPIGVGIGVLGGVLTPGLYYKAKAGDNINVQLTNSLVVEK